ncbi:hypothetical protein RJ640_022804 [Escallonia rubra]|uniref:Uncharacterized protein n=1 Tax=Escallonia rubra TaxID=112253 RepID=A0AA88S5M1_9ASTE|nr:hypothetical protein RJ640_022804 [Escallonia rubra]
MAKLRGASALLVLALKAISIEEPNIIFTRNWSEGIAFSKWIGISCSNDGRAATLNLSNMGLKGTIGPSPENISNKVFMAISLMNFGRLHQLQSLKQQLNEYGGKLPSSLSKMLGAQTTLSCSKQVPSKNIKRIGNLTKLEICTVV